MMIERYWDASGRRVNPGQYFYGYTAAVVALVVEAVIAGVETGITVYGQEQQAKTQSAMASYNYAVQRQQAEMNARVADQQAQWAQQEDQAQYEAEQNNAKTLDNQALAQQAAGRAQAEQMRLQNEQQLATLRAHYAASGVTSEGSPLAVMANTAGLLELGVQQKNYQTQLDSTATQHQADDERFKSGSYLMDQSVERYKSAAADAGLQVNLEQTGGGLASGLAGAQETRSQIPGLLVDAAGKDVEKIGNTAGDLARYNDAHYDPPV